MDSGIMIYVIAFVLLIVGIAAARRKEKKVMGVGKGWIAGIFVIIAIFLFTMQLGYLADYGISPLATTVPGAVTPPTQATPSGICAVEDTTVTLSATNKFTAEATGGSHRYRINGAPALVVSDAGTLTASPGDAIQIFWGNGTQSTYYGEVSSETVPCAGTKTFTQQMVRNGTLTIEVFNEEGNLIDNSAENETLGAGDVVTLTARLKGTYQRGFPHGGVMVVEFNGTGSSSVIDDVIVDFGGSEVEVPSIYTITLSTQARTKAYSIPPILSNQILEGSVVIDADDTNNPTSLGDPILTFYPNDYFINEDTGGSFDGPAVEDEDDAQTFVHSTAFTLGVD